MQLCLIRSCGCSGTGLRGEVSGRSDGNQAPVRPDANRDHILLDAFPQPNAGVETVLDDVAEPVVYAELELDVGIVSEHSA